MRFVALPCDCLQWIYIHLFCCWFALICSQYQYIYSIIVNHLHICVYVHSTILLLRSTSAFPRTFFFWQNSIINWCRLERDARVLCWKLQAVLLALQICMFLIAGNYFFCIVAHRWLFSVHYISCLQYCCSMLCVLFVGCNVSYMWHGFLVLLFIIIIIVIIIDDYQLCSEASSPSCLFIVLV